MSRVDELIAKHTPNGVEFRTLGDIARFVRGNGMPKTDLVGEGVGAIHYGQIYTRYGVWATETISFVAPETAMKLAKAQPGDLIITNTSENVEDVGKAVAWLGSEPIVTGGHATVIQHDLDPKYLAYWFQSESFSVQKRALATGTKVIDVSARQLAKVRLPVPPIEVQREIVRVLDPLTQLKADLEEELEAELEARTQQYAHCRPTLLTFGQETDWYSLTEVADYANGKAHEKLADPDGTVPMVTARFVSRNGEANRFVRAQDVLMPADVGDIALVLSDLPNGRALARTFYVDRANGYAINQRVARIRVKDPELIDSRYLFHVLDRNPGLLKYDNGADQTHLSKSQVTELRIPVPSIDEQRRVAHLLDQLKSLVDELSVNLSAELRARRTQYEYYRDKLFAFPEATA
ncbi:restriction endonuclease subunit S [Microbacterium sp.]|uniref:restriction endonuclease subunit S n=1 Tax=Microbacterium sp. TaxID=51671 RepID=UPI0028B05E1B|nr:restriction endonuclease subunit S [Microbacterium sp.]